MRKNVFVISMLRQPVRTALLMLLIALAAGAFVMRGLEFQTIRGTFDELGGRYRAVGFLRNAEFRAIPDVYSGAEILRGSEFIEFEDRRRGVTGVMSGVLNAYARGMPRREYIWSHYSHTFFYGEVLEISGVDEASARITVRADEVVAGYPEHIIAGQEAVIRFRATPSCIAAGINPANYLTVGQRYFFRAVFYHWDVFPRIGYTGDILELKPLNQAVLRDDGYGTRPVTDNLMPEEPLWFMEVMPGESVDYTAAGFEWLAKEIRWHRHAQSSINLRTTVCMASMPKMWQGTDVIRLTQGRLLDREDYLAANPVIVIHEHFAARRGLELGDVLTITVPRENVIKNFFHYFDANNNMIAYPYVLSLPDDSENVLTLEIVGMYEFTFGGRHQLEESVLAYIPDSVLPHGEPVGWFGRENYIYLPDVWYSFVLNDAADRTAFLRRYSELLSQMGYVLTVPETGAENFHATAAPVIQAITFNLIVFGAVTLLVFAPVVWLFLRQRRKDFAIMRALGCSGGNTFGRLAAALAVFGVPSVAVGGVAAWFLARRQIENTLHPFEEIVYGFEPVASLEIYLLPVLMAAAVAGLFVLFVIFSRVFSRPVLELLQK